MVGVPFAASNGLIAVIVIVPIALVVLVMLWIMLRLTIGSQVRSKRGERVIQEQSDQRDVATEFEQMRRRQAGE